MKKKSWWSSLIIKEKSKDRAKERLQLVLLHDRSDLSPDLLNKIKDDIVAVLSKYVVVDMNEIEIQLTRAENENNDLSAFVANIPIVSVKDSDKKRTF